MAIEQYILLSESEEWHRQGDLIEDVVVVAPAKKEDPKGAQEHPYVGAKGDEAVASDRPGEPTPVHFHV